MDKAEAHVRLTAAVVQGMLAGRSRPVNETDLRRYADRAAETANHIIESNYSVELTETANGDVVADIALLRNK